ncbi:hypothetical protein Tco_0420761 [Tanacetum coccineum]
MKSVLTQSALDALCEKFHIPDTVHPKLPGPNDRIRNSPTSKIGVYSRCFDFSNYRIPLSQFLVDILEYFQFNLSQLSVITATKTAEDLQGDALLHYDAEMELMNLILLSIPNEIYISMDTFTTAKEMWK